MLSCAQLWSFSSHRNPEEWSVLGRALHAMGHVNKMQMRAKIWFDLESCMFVTSTLNTYFNFKKEILKILLRHEPLTGKDDWLNVLKLTLNCSNMLEKERKWKENHIAKNYTIGNYICSIDILRNFMSNMIGHCVLQLWVHIFCYFQGIVHTECCTHII